MRPPAGMVRSTAALVLLVLLMPLASCSDEPDQPGTLPTAESSSGSPSATPSPSTPEQEVEAAVRNYYAVLEAAAKSGNATELKRLVARGCPCYRAVRVIERNARVGERTPGIDIALTSVRVHSIEPRLAGAEVRTTDAAYDVVDQKGKVVARIPDSTTHLDLSLVKDQGGRWIVSNSFDLES